MEAVLVSGEGGGGGGGRLGVGETVIEGKIIV